MLKKTDLHHCSVHMAVSCFLTFSCCLSAASTLCNIDGKQGDRNPQGAQRRRSHTNGEGKRLHSFLSESLVFLKLPLAQENAILVGLKRECGRPLH